MSKIAVLFPGIGYTVDKPLLYYSRRLVQEYGYTHQINIAYVTNQGESKTSIRGDERKLREKQQLLFQQAEEQLADIDWNAYDDILFLSKSIGTAVACEYAYKHELLHVKHVLYTPLTLTFDYAPAGATAFIGTEDGWSDVHKVEELASLYGIPLKIYSDCNHSLETKDTFRNLEILNDVMHRTDSFLSEQMKDNEVET